jgi:mono/diheme cytochrome c family protein
MGNIMKRLALAVLAALVVTWGLASYFGLREDEAPGTSTTPSGKPSPELLAKGAYLARAGDCMACHTARGGAPYAGGRAIQTPFGAIPSPNITPDKETGIGNWSADDFWRALHNGKSKDGTLLYPAFPYPNYTLVTRADSDALYAYLQALRAVRQPNKQADLHFPFNYRSLLAVWRALYFRPGVYDVDPKRNAEWNRGAYLVQGLGHCNACHSPRNLMGATETQTDLGGAKIPTLNWYAASLSGDPYSGLGAWEPQHVSDLLKSGVSALGAASGPMGEVVRESLQHLSDEDIRAMTAYLKSLPPSEVPEEVEEGPTINLATLKILKQGAALYEKHCVTCHKTSGEGEPPHIPPLVGNRAILHGSPVNPIRLVLHGGYPPSTEGNPYPYGMPPFGALLSDEEVAAIVSYVRNDWGNHASMVSSAQVNRNRAIPLD